MQIRKGRLRAVFLKGWSTATGLPIRLPIVDPKPSQPIVGMASPRPPIDGTREFSSRASYGCHQYEFTSTDGLRVRAHTWPKKCPHCFPVEGQPYPPAEEED